MSPASSLTLIAAALPDGGVGCNGRLPWRLPGDMHFFQQTTSWMGRAPGSAFPQNDARIDSASTAPLNVVIMGRVTWDSIPLSFRPLQNRLNIVLSRNPDFRSKVRSTSTRETPSYSFPTLDAALAFLQNTPHTNVFVIGGAQLYASCISHGLCTRILLTAIDPPRPITCDAFFPPIPQDLFRLADHQQLLQLVGPRCPLGLQTEKGFSYEFQLWVRRTSPDSSVSRSRASYRGPQIAVMDDHVRAGHQLPRMNSHTSAQNGSEHPSVSDIAPSSADSSNARSYSLSHSHPLLSLQIDPSLVLLPSDASIPTTILPEDLATTSGVDPPPEGVYSPVFSLTRSPGSNGKLTQLPAGRSDMGWVGVNSTLGGTPSQCAAEDDDRFDLGDAYDTLIKRVEEVLSGGEHDSDDDAEAEASLLQKVHEILQTTSHSEDGLRGTYSFQVSAKGFPQQQSQNMSFDERQSSQNLSSERPTDLRKSERSLLERQAESARKTRHASFSGHGEKNAIEREASAMPTAIDFSLADGTYAFNGNEADFSRRNHVPAIFPAGNHAGADKFSARAHMHGELQEEFKRNPHALENAASYTTPQQPGLQSPAHDPRRMSNVGGMAGTRSICVPRIEYESFVTEEDTVVERALEPLLAKYVPSTLLPGPSPPAVAKYAPPNDALASERGSVTSNGARMLPSSYPRHAAIRAYSNNSSSSGISMASSATFADQLSLASLEYMQRHALMGQNDTKRHGSGRSTDGGETAHPAPGGATRHGSSGTRGSGPLPSLPRQAGAKPEQMSKVLDVERIRRLPKLGMPDRR